MSRLFDEGKYLESASSPVSGVPLSISLWMYTDDLATDHQIPIEIYVDGTNYFSILVRTTGEIRVYTNDGGVADYAGTTANMGEDAWHHIAAVYAATDDRRAFLDGGNKGTNATDLAPDATDTVRVGAADWDDRYVSGSLCEIGIWNAALTDDEVAALAGGVSPARIRPDSLVAYWPLYGVGSPEPDYRGTYNLTLNGAPAQSDHGPVQPPFGHGISWIEPAPAAVSPSASISPSASESPSVSPSASLSPSASESPSESPSISPSASESPSESPSVSPSASISPSASESPSPSPGYTGYTRGDEAVLPADDTDLETVYDAGEINDVATKNDVRVGQSATGEYAIHQYKNFVGATGSCTLEWEGQTNCAPSFSTVHLQIYNRNLPAWEDVDTDNASPADADFPLSGNIADLTNYKDGSNVISCRIYQLAV